MKISAVIEGGMGDMILASRLLAAIKEKHPDSELTVFANNERNWKFNEFFCRHWGHLFDDFDGEIDRRGDFFIESQFGRENYRGAIENITDAGLAKINAADKVYNLHLDSLAFTRSDLPWAKYARYVPAPRCVASEALPVGTVLVNLFARTGHFSGVSSDYACSLISALRKIHPVVVIAPSEEAREEFYAPHRDVVRVTSLSETLSLVSAADCGVSIDTGVRCMFYSVGKPCLTLCGLAKKPFEIPASHQLRWYLMPEHILPVDAKPLFVQSLISNIIENPACAAYPQISARDIDNFLLKRKYD